jgi:hypothetical protein
MDAVVEASFDSDCLNGCIGGKHVSYRFDTIGMNKAQVKANIRDGRVARKSFCKCDGNLILHAVNCHLYEGRIVAFNILA